MAQDQPSNTVIVLDLPSHPGWICHSATCLRKVLPPKQDKVVAVEGQAFLGYTGFTKRLYLGFNWGPHQIVSLDSHCELACNLPALWRALMALDEMYCHHEVCQLGPTGESLLVGQRESDDFLSEPRLGQLVHSFTSGSLDFALESALPKDTFDRIWSEPFPVSLLDTAAKLLDRQYPLDPLPFRQESERLNGPDGLYTAFADAITDQMKLLGAEEEPKEEVIPTLFDEQPHLLEAALHTRYRAKGKKSG